MIDAVLSYHMNPATCGVAKFNQRLARELSVPCADLVQSIIAGTFSHPLISVKLSEVHELVMRVPSKFDVFFHDWSEAGQLYVYGSERIYAANQVIAEAIRQYRPDVIEAWCPSTIEGNPTRGRINVLTFGMSHKIQTARYEKLKALLDATGEDYTVSVSTAIHEGSPWDETARVGERLRGIFADRLRVLGYLADDGLAAELQRATAVALFFDPALRANNTTFWAAMESGTPVVTNVDSDSPMGIYHDIDTMRIWPAVSVKYPPQGAHLWKDLVTLMQEQPCAK